MRTHADIGDYQTPKRIAQGMHRFSTQAPRWLMELCGRVADES